MICKLCKHDHKLVKSHVIPRSFFKQDKDEQPYWILPRTQNEYIKRSPTGIYDQEMVCTNCEKLFCPFDTYGHEFLAQLSHARKKIQQNEKETEILEVNYDYNKLKLFFIITLWRAHHCKHEFFKNVRLGAHHENILGNMILTCNPGSKDDYSAIITKFEYPSKDGLELMAELDPDRLKLDGINCYRFYFASYRIFIKVDQQPFKDSLRDIAISETGKGIILLKDFRESKEYPVVLNKVRLPYQNK